MLTASRKVHAGRFKGYQVAEVPSDYLRRAAKTWRRVGQADAYLIAAMRAEVQWRDQYDKHFALDDRGRRVAEPCEGRLF